MLNGFCSRVVGDVVGPCLGELSAFLVAPAFDLGVVDRLVLREQLDHLVEPLRGIGVVGLSCCETGDGDNNGKC